MNEFQPHCRGTWSRLHRRRTARHTKARSVLNANVNRNYIDTLPELNVNSLNPTNVMAHTQHCQALQTAPRKHFAFSLCIYAMLWVHFLSLLLFFISHLSTLSQRFCFNHIHAAQLPLLHGIVHPFACTASCFHIPTEWHSVDGTHTIAFVCVENVDQYMCVRVECTGAAKIMRLVDLLSGDIYTCRLVVTRPIIRRSHKILPPGYHQYN